MDICRRRFDGINRFEKPSFGPILGSEEKDNRYAAFINLLR